MVPFLSNKGTCIGGPPGFFPVRGDVKIVRKLQKTLMRSWSAKALAVRKVTQDNQGKKTAGVDGVKSLIPKARLLDFKPQINQPS